MYIAYKFYLCKLFIRCICEHYFIIVSVNIGLYLYPCKLVYICMRVNWFIFIYLYIIYNLYLCTLFISCICVHYFIVYLCTMFYSCIYLQFRMEVNNYRKEWRRIPPLLPWTFAWLNVGKNRSTASIKGFTLTRKRSGKVWWLNSPFCPRR